MTDAYRWELINTLRSATLADLLATVPEVNQRTFIDAAQLLEERAKEIKPLCADAADEIERLVKRNIKLETALDRIEAICKHGPDSSEALPDTLPDKRWGFPNESD